MFIRGLADYTARQPNWKVDDWLVSRKPSTTLIPGVSNTTAAVGAGAAVGLAALAAAAWYYFRK